MSRVIVVMLFALAGCTRAVPLPATLVADDGDALFDTVAGVQFVRRTFNFTNIGDTATDALTVELRGDVGHFDVEWDGCSGVALAAHATCQVVARLLAVSDGSFDGELHVFGKAPLSASVLMHGKVMPASLSLTPMTTTWLDAVQGQKVSLAFIARNDGGVATGPLHITGPGAPFDSRSANCDGVSLAGGATCVITIVRAIAPDAPLASSSGTLDVNATPGGDASLTAGLNVRAGGVFIVENTDWGPIPTLQSQQRVVTVTNPGPAPAGAMTVALVSNEMVPPFTITANACKTKRLGVGESCQVTVTALVTDTLQHTATLTATADNLKPGSATLTASGLRAHWSIQLTFAGTGTGKVTHNSASYSSATMFVIANGQTSNPFTAVADSGSTFTGWTGTAACTGTGPCDFVGPDNGDVTLVANFSH